jgi:outer membrane protein OmpA-like peptidoglycan-associated protein
MTISLRTAGAVVATAFWAGQVCAQPAAQPAASAAQAPSAQTPAEVRPATTTFTGDTGFWFVPSAEVLPDGKWSASAYRRGTNWIQGYTNVADFAGTFAYGLRGRTELFGSFLVDTRVDRDIRPLFLGGQIAGGSNFGGVLDRYPGVSKGWSGDNVGDFYAGAKFNIWSEERLNPAAVAVRAVAKLPTASIDNGVGTGKFDLAFDGIVTKEASKVLDVSAYGGWEFRGQPDGYDAPSGAFRWGAGIGVPSRGSLRFTGEINGDVPNKSTLTFQGVTVPCVDCGVMPLVSDVQTLTRATLGITFQAKNGFFASAGASWNFPTLARLSAFSPEGDVTGDYVDWQFRIGFHPGVRVYVAPLPPPQPPPELPTPQNRPPTVRARCEPCTVEAGRTVTVTADAQDPDGDVLSYRWAAPAGAFQNVADRQTLWTAPQQEGPVPVTVTVSDGHGGTASDNLTVQVLRTRQPVVELTFEDVYFDFDRSSLRPDALRLLDDAIARLQANPDKSIVIEGHTCSIGTAEYNLALGSRRAASVRDYLLSRGIAASRMETRSYGEERPKFDNAREETRRLNRRAALVVRVQ